jgi:hypothetical protein
MRHEIPWSIILSSWQRGAIDGIGRDHGRPRDSPCWSRRSRYPHSILAAEENGGVLTSPCSQTRGLSEDVIGTIYVISDILSTCGGWPRILESPLASPYIASCSLHRHFPRGGCRFVLLKCRLAADVRRVRVATMGRRSDSETRRTCAPY